MSPSRLAEIREPVDVVFVRQLCTLSPYQMRRHISAELKKVALRLAIVKGFKYKKIWKITGISEQSIQRLVTLHRHTGYVARKRTVDGRPRILNGFELSVSGIYCVLINFECVGSFLRAVLNNSWTCC